MYRAFLFSLALAATTFVSPQNGSQAIGPMWLEVTTTATHVDRVEFSIDGVLAGVARQAPWRMAHDFGTSPASHVITAKVFANGYRDVETASVTTAALTAGETMSVDLVEVPLRVRASKTIAAGDLRIVENGVEQTVREVRADRGPARFVFVVDRSLSMGDGRLDAALRAIDAEAQSLRDGDRVEVVLFNHTIARPRTLARGERAATLFANVVPSGGTSLRDALASIASRERTYAIVITDGGDRNSQLSEDDALQRISGTKTTVDAIVLGDRSRFLGRAAKNTGGVIAEADVRTLQRALHAMIVDINSRYTAVYQSHGTRSGWRAIEVAPRRSGISIVHARKGYFAE